MNEHEINHLLSVSKHKVKQILMNLGNELNVDLVDIYMSTENEIVRTFADGTPLIMQKINLNIMKDIK